MAKWNCLFGWVKRLFTSESNVKSQNPKKWRWSLGIGRFKWKQYSANKTLIEAKSKHRKHALAVAVATAAAAEAAVAAANAAAEVVRLTASSRSYSNLSKGDQDLAAIKIQSAYRAHLARKALRALKGVVKLQAIVRGQAVRRQVSITLEKLTSIARKRVEIQEGRSLGEQESHKNDKIKQSIKPKKLQEKEIKTECCSQRTRDCNLHSREDIEAILFRKQEAIFKRERMKQYSCAHQETTSPIMVEEYVPNKEFGRENKQWLHKETCNWNVFYKSASLPSNLVTKELYGTPQASQRKLKKEDLEREGLSSQISMPRKSFSHAKRSFLVDDNSMPNSPVFPSYMALTESSRAKVRSLSTPRERTRFLDIYSNQSVPQMEGVSFWTSYYDATTHTNGKNEASEKRCSKTANCHYYN